MQQHCVSLFVITKYAANCPSNKIKQNKTSSRKSEPITVIMLYSSFSWREEDWNSFEIKNQNESNDLK
jgi:hypothetical protein